MDKAEIRAIVEKLLVKQGLLQEPGTVQKPIPPTGPSQSRAAPILKTESNTEQNFAPLPPVRPEMIPVEVSARHVHLDAEAVTKLFGPGAVLNSVRGLSQPGEFLSEQRVTLIGPQGRLDKVAILGPERKVAQAELSMTDARILGIEAPLRLSGDLSGAGEIEIAGPAGSVRARAAIIAKIHLHLRPRDAGALGLKNGSSVRVRIKSRRPLTFDDVPVRVREDFMPALHIDFDEANACMFQEGDAVEILSPAGSVEIQEGPASGRKVLVTEADAKKLAKAGGTIKFSRGTILTPSARDVFFEARRGIEWEP